MTANIPDSDQQRPPKNAQPGMFPNLPLSQADQEILVKKCKEFKEEAKKAARSKREKMRRAYHYINGEFMPGTPGELLPTYGMEGDEKNIKTGRPQVFMPVARQIYKTLYSQIKLTLFPNDEDYFRVRAKTEEAAALEDVLTEGLKFIFKEMLLTEKLGIYIQNLIWAGNGQAYPFIEDCQYWEWHLAKSVQMAPVMGPDGQPAIGPDGQPMLQEQPMLDEDGQEQIQYELAKTDEPPKPAIQVWHPMNFFLDPSQQDPEGSKWTYSCNKKLQTILDSGVYFNKERLIGDEIRKDAAYANTLGSMDQLGNLPLEGDGNSSTFTDIEGNVIEDIYYFPFIKIGKKEYRNIIASIANDKHVIRFHPNLYPRGMNPVVATTYCPCVESPEGGGPIEDILELQRTINLLWNYKLEVMARCGNRFGVKKGTDTTHFWGGGGGLMFLEDPARDVVPLSGNFNEIAMLTNETGVLKAEAQITSGAQNPFQGSSNVDFQKTATELQILQENSITVVREAIEHIAVTGIKRILELLMYLIADLHKEPLRIRIDDAQGSRFEEVDFRVLRSGDYYIDVVSSNPGQGKKAQTEMLQGWLEMATRNPEFLQWMKGGGYQIMKKLATISGIKDFSELFNTPQEMAQQQQMMMEQQYGPQGQPGILQDQAGMAA